MNVLSSNPTLPTCVGARLVANPQASLHLQISQTVKAKTKLRDYFLHSLLALHLVLHPPPADLNAPRVHQHGMTIHVSPSPHTQAENPQHMPKLRMKKPTHAPTLKPWHARTLQSGRLPAKRRFALLSAWGFTKSSQGRVAKTWLVRNGCSALSAGPTVLSKNTRHASSHKASRKSRASITMRPLRPSLSLHHYARSSPSLPRIILSCIRWTSSQPTSMEN